MEKEKSIQSRIGVVTKRQDDLIYCGREEMYKINFICAPKTTSK